MAERRIDPRVEIGSIRLRVANLDRALDFYEHTLGFEITHRLGEAAAFLSADGVHSHVVVSIAGDGAVPPPCAFAIRYPDRESLAAACRAIEQAGSALDGAVDEGFRESLSLRDPDGNHVELYWERAPDQWPREADGRPRLTPRPLDLETLRAAGQDDGRASTVPPPEPVPALTNQTRTRLGEVRLRLLNLHKVLLDDAKTSYELDRGRVGSTANLLHLVINDPWFAWLHPLSELVVRIDETLQAEAPATEADGTILLEQVERLLSPANGSEDFAQRYFEALQRQPAVIVAHAEVRRILKQAR